MRFLNEFLNFYFDQPEFQKDPVNFNIRTCVVFPNQRGCLFFQKYYADRAGAEDKTHILPAVFAWDDFVFHITGRVRVSTTTAIMMLYELIQQENVDYFQDKTMEEAWLVLKKVYGDFRRVDLAMLDEQKFFSTSSEHWKLSFWQPGETMKESEKKFLDFYTRLGLIHKKFKQLLLDNNLAYLELALRDMIENQCRLIFPYASIFFVGLVTNGEIFHQSLEYFKSSGIEVVHFVDYDPYYVSDEFPQHEAGKAYSEYLKNTAKNAYEKEKTCFLEEKTVKVYGIPLGYNQVGFLVRKLREIYQNDREKLSRVAVILADFHLLMPFLKALPSEIANETNFSMGFPLRFTMSFQLVKELIKLRKTIVNKRILSAEQLESIFLHPVLFETLGEKKIKIQNFFEKYPFISKYPYEDLNAKLLELTEDTLLQNFHEILPSCKNTPNGTAFHWLTKILTALHELLNEENELERVAIEEMVQVLTTAGSKIGQFNLDEGSIWSVILQELNGIYITLKGDPLKGLQVLGPMETAVLDFEHLYILGFNEGMWPVSFVEESYIPFQIREIHGMNTSRFLRWKYAYHFYRLLQHARTMEIFYNNIVDERYGKEPSHYIKQIEYELKPWAEKNGVQFNFEHISLGTTNLYIDQLNENDKIPIKGEKPLQLSFSELYDYVVCPYKFALKHIEKIRPEEQTTLEYASNELGSYAHKILEIIITEINKNEITSWLNARDYFNKQRLDDIIQQVDDEFFKKNENLSRYSYSFNSLMREIVKYAVSNFLNHVPKQNLYFSSLETEKRLVASVNLNGYTIKLKGILDLIEKVSLLESIVDIIVDKTSPNYILRDFKLISQLRETFSVSPKLNEEKFLDEFIKNRYRSQLLYYAMLLYLLEDSPYCNYSIACELVLLLSDNPERMFRRIMIRDPELKGNSYRESTFLKYTNRFHKEFYRLFSEQILMKYIEESEWNATPGKCQFCEYQNICYAFEG